MKIVLIILGVIAIAIILLFIFVVNILLVTKDFKQLLENIENDEEEL